MALVGRVLTWLLAVVVSLLFAYSLLIVSVTVGQPVGLGEATFVYASATVLCWATARSWAAVRRAPARPARIEPATIGLEGRTTAY